MAGRRSTYERAARARRRAAVQAVAGFKTSDEPPEWFLKRIGASIPSASGVVVTDDSALRIMSVLSCVRLLAEAVSTLPLMVFERLDGGGKRPAPEHPVSSLLHDLANVETTAQGARETACAHVLLRGESYQRLARDGGGDVREIWPLQPGTIQPRRRAKDRALVFDYSSPGEPSAVLEQTDVWRISGLSWNGCTGLSPIGLARESMGVSIALERGTGYALKNGARLSGVITYPERLQQEEYDRRKANIASALSGVENEGRVFLADAGAKFEKVGMSFQDMQFLELKRFQIAEIARLFRVPLHMLYDRGEQPRANMEQESLEFVIYSLRPWLVRIEQTVVRDLLAPAERGRFFAEHNVAGLLRGDFASRMAGYAQGRQWGWWSVNDVRELENLNRIPEGDIYLQPGNMVPAGTEPAAPSPAPAPAR